jgi:hypothetical protein
MTAARLPARAAREWIACGLARLRDERERWGGAALVYMLLAMLLHRLPFLGDLLLILLTPALLAGLLLAAQHDALPPPVPFERARWRELARAWLLVPARVFLRLFRNEERVLPVLMLSVLALGGYVALQIVGYALIGGSPVGGVGAISAAGLRAAALLVSLLALVYGLLAIALYHSVALTVLDGRTPPAALAESLRACGRNWLPLVVFAVVFLAAWAAIAGGFVVSRWLGYPLLLTLGTAALALFLPAARCSFESLHHDTRVDIADLV